MDSTALAHPSAALGRQDRTRNPMLKYFHPDILSLKNHAVLDEQWLQDRIADDPSILGLGVKVMKEAYEERR